MNWRPEGFPDHYDVLLPKYFHGTELELEHRRLATAFEAGADAMLEALREEIGKAGNPWMDKNPEHIDYMIPEEPQYTAFEDCRQKILAQLDAVKKELEGK